MLRKIITALFLKRLLLRYVPDVAAAADEHSEKIYNILLRTEIEFYY